MRKSVGEMEDLIDSATILHVLEQSLDLDLIKIGAVKVANRWAHGLVLKGLPNRVSLFGDTGNRCHRSWWR